MIGTNTTGTAFTGQQVLGCIIKVVKDLFHTDYRSSLAELEGCGHLACLKWLVEVAFADPSYPCKGSERQPSHYAV